VIQQLLPQRRLGRKAERGAGSWGPWKVQGPSSPQAKTPGLTSPTSCSLVWGTKCSGEADILQQEGVSPHRQTSLQHGVKPLYQTVENTKEALS